MKSMHNQVTNNEINANSTNITMKTIRHPQKIMRYENSTKEQ